MEMLVGIVVLVLGLAVCFFGLQAFFIMLPIWGFIGGFFLGAGVISGWLGDGFLQTTLGIVVGLLVGVVFALLAYFYWYFGALFAAASVGALLGTGLARAIGLEANWLLFIVAVVAGAIFFVAAWVLNLPVYIVIVNTAFAGAAAAIAGFLLLFRIAPLDDMRYGPAYGGQAPALGWLWFVAWIVLAVAGVFYQMRSISATESQLPDARWAPARG